MQASPTQRWEGDNPPPIVGLNILNRVGIPGGVTRDTLAEAMKVLPRTPSHLNPATILVNNVTIWDIVKFGRDEIGGDLSEIFPPR